MSRSATPKLRPLDIRPFMHDGVPTLLLRDPLQLSDGMLMVPQALSPILMFCDGSRGSWEISAAMRDRLGVRVETSLVDYVVQMLDESFLLENERFTDACARALAAYRAAPARPPSLAGHSYPDSPEALRRQLDGYLAKVDAQPSPGTTRGLVTPHIDYMRGGTTYAAVWQRAAAAVREAEVVILTGTDHYGGRSGLTLTRQHYATPYGVLPTDVAAVDAVASAIGEQRAFAGELRHRGEHSLELAAVWLQHMRGGEPCPVVPILCGSFGDYVHGVGEPGGDPTIEAAVSALRAATAGRRTVVVASGDLAHIGPAFDGDPVDHRGREALRQVDATLIEGMCAGDPERFFQAIKRDEDRYNVCGTSCIYLSMRLLGETRGEAVGYDQCLADQQGTSFVSICGVIWE